MKKIYFATNPLGPVYYKMKPDDWDGDALDIGYNDSYEMRGVYLTRPDFSENYEDIKNELEKNKRALISKKYKKLLELINIKFDETNAIEHDGFYAP